MSKGGIRLLLTFSCCCLVLLDEVGSLLMKSQLYIKPQVAFQFHFQSGLVNLCHSQALIRLSQVGKKKKHCSTRHFTITLSCSLSSRLLEDYFHTRESSVSAPSLSLSSPPSFKIQLSFFIVNSTW